MPLSVTWLVNCVNDHISGAAVEAITSCLAPPPKFEPFHQPDGASSFSTATVTVETYDIVSANVPDAVCKVFQYETSAGPPTTSVAGPSSTVNDTDDITVSEF